MVDIVTIITIKITQTAIAINPKIKIIASANTGKAVMNISVMTVNKGINHAIPFNKLILNQLLNTFSS